MGATDSREASEYRGTSSEEGKDEAMGAESMELG